MTAIELQKRQIKFHKTKVPHIGDIVLYVKGMVEEDGESPGEIRPAIIVRIWDENPTRESAVQLQVFTDGQNDKLNDVVWRTSVHQDCDKAPRTFHFPVK